MTYGPGAAAYTQTQVATTASQQKLIVMAYDGILRFLNQALDHMEKKEIEAKHEKLTKARAVIQELASTLNMEEGGEIARNLWNLYVFFMQKITESNLTNDPEPVRGILPAIRELRDAWAELKLDEADETVKALDRRVPAAEDGARLSVTG
ncbi:flagellar export chaperone FliS [Deferrisoma camini]|uniref:flagellar export chaperone FliS n=1 Tax=Deferrisoma camini TaxID=1035120 RepID=UPI00046D7EEB|nr:flagellar export chaperone FliS [Deferrisoma camini]